MEQRFCDGVEEVSVVAGVVRVDFFTYTTGPKDKNGRPARELSHRLLLSPDAFLQTYGVLDEVRKQLEQKGVIKRREDTPVANVPAAAKPAAKSGKAGA